MGQSTESSFMGAALVGDLVTWGARAGIEKDRVENAGSSRQEQTESFRCYERHKKRHKKMGDGVKRCAPKLARRTGQKTYLILVLMLS